MTCTRLLGALAALLLATALGVRPVPAADGRLTVFAAASTTEAVTELAKLFQRKTGTRVVASFASSAALARQIEQGAPADVFLSANPQWMDVLAERELIVPETRSDLLGNRLVLIAPAASAGTVTIAEGFPLAEMLGDGRLAVGDPDHVPAGQYAKQALQALGVWTAVAPKLARAGDARAALTLVERGEAPFGIVYASDAAATPRVRVVAGFPPESHAPIIYPVAVVAGRDGPSARAFVDFLKTPEAGQVFRKHGFSVSG